jgi:hypothetical protein
MFETSFGDGFATLRRSSLGEAAACKMLPEKGIAALDGRTAI